MATGNSNRDVRMTLSVETLGDEDIKKLQSTVASLAKEGGDAAPEFQKLADEIGRIGDQAAALRTFTDLAAQTEALKVNQTEAAAKSAELRTQLDALSAAAQESAASQRRANDALVAAQTAQAKAKADLAALKVEYQGAARGSETYLSRLRELTAEQGRQTTALPGLRDALQKANAELAAAEGDVRKLTSAFTASEQATLRAGRALDANAAQVRAAADSALDLGVTTDNIAASQAELQQALNSTGRAAETLQQRVERLAAQERELDGIRVFQKKVDDASRLQQTAEYVRLYDESLRRLAETERKAQEAASAEKWQREAEAMVDAAHAAQELARQTQILEAAQEELAAQRAFDKQVQDAAKLQQAAAYVRAWREELDKAEEQARKTAEESKLSAERIRFAFGAVGVRSTQELRMAIAEVRAGMETVRTSAGLTGGALKAAFASGDSKIKALERELREVSGALTMADRAAGLLKNSLGQIAAGNIIADGVGYLINQVKEMGREFIVANLEMERLTRTMTVITGSAQGAADKIEFLRKVANLSGQAVGTIADSFIRFQASASTAGMAAEEVDGIFQAVAVSGSKMGMSSDRVALALDALGQIAAKNVLSMEELRQQLGDSLPGAFSIAAKGLQVTTEELVKMVETGQVLAGEFFPAFKRGLEDAFGSSEQQVEGLYQAWNRLRNAFRELYQEASGSSAFKLLEASMDGLAKNLSAVVDVTFGFGKALLALKLFEFIRGFSNLGVAAKASAVDIATQTTAVVTNTASTAANTSAKLANAAASRTQAAANAVAMAAGNALTGTLGILAGSFRGLAVAARGAFAMLGGLPGLLLAVALNARELGTWIGESAAKMMGWGKVIDDANRKLAEQAAREKALVEEKKRAVAETERQIQRESQAQEKARVQAEERVKAAEKATAVDKDRAALIERISALYGTEAEQVGAATQAADINAAAAARELAARQESVAALEQEIATKTRLIETSTNVSQKVRDELIERQNQLAVSREEMAQSEVAVQSARIEAAERRIVAEAYKDNSEKVDQYRDAMESSRGVVADLLEMEKQGLPVKQALSAAELDLATNTRLYTDALTDKIAKTNAGIAAQQADITLSNAGLTARQAQLRNLEELAKANGNETAAIYAKIEQKRIEIQIIEATSRAQVIEQQGIIETANLKLKEARDRGTLTELMKIELETSIKLAEAKIIEAKSRGQATGALEREISLLRQSEGVRNSNRGSIDSDTSSRERNANAINKQTSALEKQNLTSDGFKKNADGSTAGSFNNSLPVDQAFAIAKKLERGTLTADDLEAAKAGAEQARNAKEWLDAQSSGATSMEARTSTEAIVKATGRALGIVQEKVKREEAKQKEGSGVGSGFGGAPAGQYAPQPSGTKTVNINIGGRSTAVNVASDADASALTSVLRQLESAAGASA